MVKKLLFSAIVATFFSPVTVNAAMLAIETGVMNWNSNATETFGEFKDANSFVSIKGATGSEFGDIYGHVKLENFDNSNLLGSEINLVGQINLADTDFNLYGQVFDKSMPNWGETNTLLGLSWDKSYDSTYVQLALAAHVVNATYKAFDKSFDEQGFNGGYAYINFSHSTSVMGQDFSFIWWQEVFFGRNDFYLQLAGDVEDVGFNGQFIAKWHANTHWSAAVSYRYAENNMGKKGYHDGIFYSVQYNF
ncbi:outer membrane protein OmpK [Shewanella sp. NIFS-20-20]|uniref:outer membrane protein OmpK n=1 Tax=Shewanella sp. NIFS-20-20 TaxID=2853806 RepID=UPI001C489A37|nr:outer membrane protein OmpK [Shewanella sp. NIFS-20-20]MBV7317459.1 hypothetical protein [Shewanella sp. NIFS-20-20]